jgi:hypothetical protein
VDSGAYAAARRSRLSNSILIAAAPGRRRSTIAT